MRKLLLIGGGGHGKSVLDAAINMRTFDEIAIIEKKELLGSSILGCKVIGTDDDIGKLYEEGYHYIFIGVGSVKDTSTRRALWNKIINANFNIINVIDPTAVIAGEVDLGVGIFIGKHAVVNTGAKIGNMAIINTSAVIEHGCIIGEFTHTAVGAILCGDVHVGNDTFIGANATVIQGLIIKDNSFINAGALVSKSL